MIRTSILRSSTLAPLMFLVFAGSAIAQPIDHLGVPGPIQFEGRSYELLWSGSPIEGYIKQEYGPPGQPVAYTDMMLIEVHTTPLTPVEAMEIQAEALEGRRSIDPITSYDLAHNIETGEAMIDFVIANFNVDPVFIEWNAYRFISVESGRRLGMIGISRRAYGSQPAADFLAGITEARNSALRQLADLEITLSPVPVQAPEAD